MKSQQAGIPTRIHLDPNMNPAWSYRHLHLLPILFDSVSVWSFAPNRCLAANPSGLGLSMDLWKELFLGRRANKAFVYAHSPQWLHKPDSSSDPSKHPRLRDADSSWNEELDGALSRAPESVVTFTSQPETLDLAVRTAGLVRTMSEECLGSAALRSITPCSQDDLQLRSLLAGGPEERLQSAWSLANGALAADRKAISLDSSIRLLPATMVEQKKVIGLVEEVGSLAALVYEHITKVEMVRQISRERLPHRLYFPPLYHALLQPLFAQKSTAALLEGVLPSLASLASDAHHLEPLGFPDEFLRWADDRKPSPFSGELYVRWLEQWQKLGGPHFLRTEAEAWTRNALKGADAARDSGLQFSNALMQMAQAAAKEDRELKAESQTFANLSVFIGRTLLKLFLPPLNSLPEEIVAAGDVAVDEFEERVEVPRDLIGRFYSRMVRGDRYAKERRRLVHLANLGRKSGACRPVYIF